jgi:hypothetical protein
MRKDFSGSIGFGGSKAINGTSQGYNRGSCDPAGGGYKPKNSYGNGKPRPEFGASKPGPVIGKMPK